MAVNIPNIGSIVAANATSIGHTIGYVFTLALFALLFIEIVCLVLRKRGPIRWCWSKLSTLFSRKTSEESAKKE